MTCSFHDMETFEFSSYRPVKKQKKVFPGQFRLSEWYTCSRTLLANVFLKSFEGSTNYIRPAV